MTLRSKTDLAAYFYLVVDLVVEVVVLLDTIVIYLELATVDVASYSPVELLPSQLFYAVIS